MGAIRKIEIALDEESVAEAHAVVATGEFASLDDVVQQALDEWHHQRAVTPEYTAHLRQLWEEGLASGPAIEGNFDLDDIKRRAAERDAAR